MIDQLRLFNESLNFIKRRTIKIEEEKLYSNQCETIILRVKNDESRLTKILYVFDLEINLLFDKRFIKCELRESFNNDDLYMHTKQDVEMLRAFARDDIYVIDKITLELNEYALTIIYTSFNESISIALIASSTTSNSRKLSSNSKTHNSIESFKHVVVSIFKKRDLYTL